MNLDTVLVFFVYQVFYGLLTFNYANASRAGSDDLSAIEWKLWREDTLFATGATLFVFAARIVGIAFLVYLGFRTHWYYAIGLFVGTLIALAILNAVLRSIAGPVWPALAAFLVLPVAGTWMWFTV